uniref:Uncharacterized protein n=1 Tax=viral metagenome TaxID=1070528 RepID=A0A6C0JFA3_9ZZZZ
MLSQIPNYIYIPLFGYLAYKFRYNALYYLNSMYIKGKQIKSFIDDHYGIQIVKKEYLYDENDNDVLLLDYTCFNENYKLITYTDKHEFPPYSIEYIKSIQNSSSISNIIKTKYDIICAELSYSYLNCDTIYKTDLLKSIQELSGPIGNFYSDSVNKLNPILLKTYLKECIKNNFSPNDNHKHAKSIDFKELQILLSDGNEIDLLKY